MNTKEKLMQLLELCIENQMNFDYSKTENVTISKLHSDGCRFCFYQRKSVTIEDLDLLMDELKLFLS